jgi:hypothetical protein
VGFLPVFFPPEGRLGHAPVHTQPVPVDAHQAVVFEQACLPHLEEDALLDPALEAVVGRGAGTELGGVQGLPLAAGAQDEEDGVHTGAVGRGRPTTTKGMGIHPLGDQPINLSPQIIGDAPVLGHDGIAHGRVQPTHAAVRK